MAEITIELADNTIEIDLSSSSSAAQGYAAAAATSATAAATSETNAGTSETNAGTSATAAASSATDAETAQTAAETAQTAAETAQTAAETAETNAETSETNAAASAVAAAASAVSAGLDWESDWVTSTAYAVSDGVRSDGYGSYICTSAHTSGASTEPGVGGSWETVWDIFAADAEAGSAATDSTAGIVELATIAEVDTGTDTGRAITPAGLAGSALQTKVDAIEALADVTDTANVTAAGALMDSELSAIASVKALDQGVATTDSPTFVNPRVTTIELGHASDTSLTRVSAGVAAIEGDNILMDSNIGKQTIWIPAGAMVSATTSGPASGQVEETTNAHNYATLDFDASADEYACFEIMMPKSWDEGTITFQAAWSSTAADTDGIAFALQGVAIADGADSDVAYGTAVVVTDDAQSGSGEILISAVSGAVTIAGTPAAGELCQFRCYRDVSDANDVMTEDMQLRGIQILYNTDALKDD